MCDELEAKRLNAQEGLKLQLNCLKEVCKGNKKERKKRKHQNYVRQNKTEPGFVENNYWLMTI